MATKTTKQRTHAKLGNKSLYDSLYSKESIEESKKTLATGGGEPIKKGQKWTNEKRVLQPRDPETGQFDYNASADIERKYKYHAERNGLHGNKQSGYSWTDKNRNYPENLQRAVAAFYEAAPDGMLKKGQIMTINGQRFIASLDMDAEEFKDMITSVSHDEGGKAKLSSKTYSGEKEGGSRWREKTTEDAFVSATPRGRKASEAYDKERNKAVERDDEKEWSGDKREETVESLGGKYRMTQDKFNEFIEGVKEGEKSPNILSRKNKDILPSVDRKQLKDMLSMRGDREKMERKSYEEDKYETPSQKPLQELNPTKYEHNKWFNRYAAGLSSGASFGDVPDVPYGMDPMKSKSFVNHVEEQYKKNKDKVDSAAKAFGEKIGREVDPKEFLANYFKQILDKKRNGGN